MSGVSQRRVFSALTAQFSDSTHRSAASVTKGYDGTAGVLTDGGYTLGSPPGVTVTAPLSGAVFGTGINFSAI